ncbi:unnamed protein product [Porites lobata]|uniref:Uncharacterized protein n=1 Tax=Porites lobata TaxID=104759 RepID=A0ABN8P792_9CNID|nr:unnamed protein product [Porites lobata]
MSRKLGGRGLKSVENEYKNTKIKAAVKLYCKADPTMAAVTSLEELAVQNGRHSIIKQAKKYAEELDLQLRLNLPNPTAVADGKEVEAKKVKQAIYKARQHDIQSTESLSRTDGTTRRLNWRSALRGFLSGCSALAQLRALSIYLITKVDPWLSQVTPKPLYENEHATAFWDVPLFTDTTQVKANRIDATVIDKTSKQVRAIEMRSCP